MSKQKNEKLEGQRIVTPPFRVSYPHLFKANAMKGSAPKYSVTMLFKKSEGDKAKDLPEIMAAIRAAKISQFGKDKLNWPKMASCITDGDDAKFADKEGYKGHWAIKASSIETSKPGLVDEELEPILEQALFYPGCYARAQVFARVWEFPEGSGRHGVHFILDNVQKLKDGKPFGGKKSAKDAFGAGAVSDDDSDNDSDDSDGESFM